MKCIFKKLKKYCLNIKKYFLFPSKKQRILCENYIKKGAIKYTIGVADNKKIDQINILNASFLAMHKAIKKLKQEAELLLIDGNRFKPIPEILHKCII